MTINSNNLCFQNGSPQQQFIDRTTKHHSEVITKTQQKSKKEVANDAIMAELNVSAICGFLTETD